MRHTKASAQLRAIGSIRCLAVDPGLSCTGYCLTVSDFQAGTIREFLKWGSVSSSPADTPLDRIISAGTKLTEKIIAYKPGIVIFEIPGSTVYGSGHMQKSHIMKRANDIRKTAMMIAYVIGRTEPLRTTVFTTVEPSQWQDKKGIRKCGGSKEWSCQFASSQTSAAIRNDNIADAIAINVIITAKIAQGTINGSTRK